MYYIGMDVHTKVTMICILDEFGKVVSERVLHGSLRELSACLRAMRKELAGPVKVCYEASCGAGWLHSQLVAAGFKVQVAHPGKLRLIFRSKRKNDRVDAKKLATLLFLDQVPASHMPAEEVRHWRMLIEFRSGEVRKRTACKNRLRAILRSNGIAAVGGLWSRRGLEWLAAQELSEFESLQREILMTELSDIGGRIAKVEVALKARAAKVPGVRLLMTAPGIGIRTAEAFVACVDDATRFRRNKSVGCYFGMVPCEDTSVKSRFGHITREGPAIVRRLVTEATWQAIRRDATVKAYYERICRGDANRKKIALIATAHHMLGVMHAMLISGEEWRPAA